MVLQLYQMQLLTWNAQPGDSLVFHFSGRHSRFGPCALHFRASGRGCDAISCAGHGTQVPDHSGDEDDGLCETICPCDFKIVRPDSKII